ncbi:hypothetical protein, partial [Enterococcus faecalis]|uniref:hypothetical protein n=1 Tax=Enterococcus faecalis TaxID=1351 RepID=UPI003CC575DD
MLDRLFSEPAQTVTAPFWKTFPKNLGKILVILIRSYFTVVKHNMSIQVHKEAPNMTIIELTFATNQLTTTYYNHKLEPLHQKT